jgi:hypothetical protein
MPAPTVTDAQNQENSLQALITSLTAANQDSVRPQIRTSALTLHSMLESLANTASASAQASAGTTFDSTITWTASPDGSLRDKVIDAATSTQGINSLTRRIGLWWNTANNQWNSTPEIPAGWLKNYLATYRSITGT